MLENTAELEASFASINGKTVLQHKFHKSPLKIAKTFQREGKQIGVCVMDSSPGLMAGDCYSLTWKLAEAAEVFITNQSYTKVHPCAERPAYQKMMVQIAKNARLEYRPEPIMLYKDASLHSDTEINLDTGASVLWMDIVCPGRVLRDEIFQYKCYDSCLKVYCANQLIYYNRLNLQPGIADALIGEGEYPIHKGFRGLGGWENYTHQGTLYLFTNRIKREYLAPVHHALEKYPNLLGGVSLTYKHGLVLSVLGKNVWELQQLLGEVWDLLKSLDIKN